MPLNFSNFSKLMTAVLLAVASFGPLAIAETPKAEIYEKSSGLDGQDRRLSEMKNYNICMNGEGMTIVLYDGHRLELRKGQCAKITAANVRVIPPEKQGDQNQSTGGLRYNKYTYPNATTKGGLSRPRSSQHH